MGILIEGTKVREDDKTVTYAFLNPGTDQAGRVSITKPGLGEPLAELDSDLHPAGATILMKAYRQAMATGVWPDKVLYAA